MIDLPKVLTRMILDDKTSKTRAEIYQNSWGSHTSTTYRIVRIGKNETLSLTIEITSDGKHILSICGEKYGSDDKSMKYKIDIHRSVVEDFESEAADLKAYCLSLVNE
jgi:hypothetical protein